MIITQTNYVTKNQSVFDAGADERNVRVSSEHGVTFNKYIIEIAALRYTRVNVHNLLIDVRLSNNTI